MPTPDYIPPSLAVSFGAELLDRLKPGWAHKVNTETLSLSSCLRCVLGQLYYGYDEGLRKLCPIDSGNVFSAETNRWAQRYGFNACYHSDYYILNARWREAIHARRTC